MQDQNDTPNKLTPEQETNLQIFLAKNKDRIEQWRGSHPDHVPLPVIWDNSLQIFFWQNRKQRRA